MLLPAADFESAASTNSATGAWRRIIERQQGKVNGFCMASDSFFRYHLAS